jgi:Acetyltransferase (GNAT) domain
MDEAVIDGAGVVVLDVESETWETFLSGNPNATPFHHPSWSRLLGDCYHLRPAVAALFDRSGALRAGIPLLEVGRGSHKRWVAMPFTDRCAPLLSGALELATFSERLEHARRERCLRSIEVRDALGDANGWVVPQGYWHELPLTPGPDELYAGLRRSTAQRVRRAKREGITVERARSKPELSEVFYRLHVSTRRRLGVPVQPRRFFDLLWERMLTQQLGFALIAWRGSTPVASAVFLAAYGRVTYKFSASDNRYRQLGGTNAILWEAIRSSSLNGERVFDFGRTEHGNDGLRAFKLGWGAREEPLLYTTLATAAPAARRSVAHATLGTVIRRSPALVGRLIGAFAYRYAA